MTESDVRVMVRGLPSPAFRPERIRVDVRAAGRGRLLIRGLGETPAVEITGDGEIERKDAQDLVVALDSRQASLSSAR